VCFFEVVLFAFFLGCLMHLSTMPYVMDQRDRAVMDLQVMEATSSKGSNFGVVQMCIRV
jgi:hypothetical protein